MSLIWLFWLALLYSVHCTVHSTLHIVFCSLKSRCILSPIAAVGLNLYLSPLNLLEEENKILLKGKDRLTAQYVWYCTIYEELIKDTIRKFGQNAVANSYTIHVESSLKENSWKKKDTITVELMKEPNSNYYVMLLFLQWHFYFMVITSWCFSVSLRNQLHYSYLLYFFKINF